MFLKPRFLLIAFGLLVLGRLALLGRHEALGPSAAKTAMTVPRLYPTGVPRMAAGLTEPGSSAPEPLPQATLTSASVPPSLPPATPTCVTPATWTPVTSLNTPRARLGLAYFAGNGRFYAMGGETTGGATSNAIEEYNPTANTWAPRANMSQALENTGAASVGPYVYVPGGSAGGTVYGIVERFDPTANAIATVSPLPAINAAHAVTALGTRLYVLGGSSTGAEGTTNYIYDTTTGLWSSGAPLLTAVQYAAATTDGTYVYLIGGRTGAMIDLNVVQRYDPTTNTWTLRANLLQPRGGPGVFFDGQHIWAVGGGWTAYLTTTEYYDPAANTWTAGPPANTGLRTLGAAFGGTIALKAGGWLGSYSAVAEKLPFTVGVCPTPTSTPTAVPTATPNCGTATNWTTLASLNTPRARLGLAYFAGNGRFYAMGGETTGGATSNAIEEYNPTANTWAPRANMTQALENTGAASVSGYIYAPGGSAGGTVYGIVERYDPLANAIATVSPMPAINAAHAVTALGTKLYVLGGSSTGAEGTTNYIYDTTTGSWSTGAPLLTAVQYAAATTDGTYIYVLGGRTGAMVDMNVVQRYDPTTNTWTLRANLLQARGGPGAFYDGAHIWVVGGGWNTYLNTTEYYNAATNTWTAGPTMNTGPRTLAAAFGGTIALKAGGWLGSYSAIAEKLSYAPGICPSPTRTATATPCAITFTDVHTTDFFYQGLVWLYCRGAISGYGDNTFRPGNNTTRGQMVKIVTLAYGIPTYSPPTPTFRDVPVTDPFYAYVETAAHSNIVSGYNCGGPGEPCPGIYFRPVALVTRGQLSKIVVVAAGWALLNPATATFNDVPGNNPFYGFIETAYCHQVISGYDCGSPGEPCPGKYFRPGNNATRGQIAKIVYNAVSNLPCTTVLTGDKR
jgi:N-acetylneuraminic acid mutarotase